MLSLKHWKGIIVTLLLLSSFAFSKQYTDPFFIPKNLFLFIGEAVLFFVIGIELYNKKRVTVSLNWFDGVVLLYILWSFVRLLFTEGVGLNDSKFLILLYNTGLYFILKPYLINQGFDNTGPLKSITSILFLIILGQVAWGFIQFTGISPNPQKEFAIGGSFGNPGQYTNFLVPLLAFSYASAVNKFNNRTISWIATTAVLLILPFTQARTAWIAALVVLLYITEMRFAYIRNLWKRLKYIWVKIILVSILLVAVVGASAWLYQMKKNSSSGRLFIWQVSLGMVKDKPVFGFGFDRFAAAHNDYQAAYFAQNPGNQALIDIADGVNYAFNEYLQAAVEAGIPGALLLLVITIAALSLKSDNRFKDKTMFHAARASILAIGISALFSYPFHTVPSLLIFFISLAIIGAYSKLPVKVFEISNFNKKAFAVILVISSIVTLLIMVQRDKAERQWTEAFKLMRQNRLEEAYTLYSTLYSDLEYNQFFLFNYGAELSLMKRYTESIEVLKKAEPRLNDSDFYIYLANDYENLGNYAEAEKNYEKASYIMPSKFFPKYKLVTIYLKTNREKEAIALAKHILSMKIKVPSQTIDSILLEMSNLVKNENS